MNQVNIRLLKTNHHHHQSIGEELLAIQQNQIKRVYLKESRDMLVVSLVIARLFMVTVVEQHV